MFKYCWNLHVSSDGIFKTAKKSRLLDHAHVLLTLDGHNSDTQNLEGIYLAPETFHNCFLTACTRAAHRRYIYETNQYLL